MKAPDLHTLLDFESNWDSALKAVLGSISGITAHVGLNLEKRESPNYSGFFTFMGEAPADGGTQPQQRGGGGPTQFDPVSFQGRFTVFLETHRKDVPPESITYWRGELRRKFLPSEIQRGFNGTVLPYYDMRSISWVGGERLIDEERDLDQTSMVFEFDWTINADAWPN